MLSTLQRLANTAHVDDSDGFTLIELLIVVVIIGILAAIAIPQFSSTKESAYDASAKSDLRNLMTTQEAHFARHSEYGDVSAGTGTVTVGASGGTGIEMNLSQNVELAATAQSGSYTATAQHTSSDNTFCVAVNTGGTQDGQVVNGNSCGGGS